MDEWVINLELAKCLEKEDNFGIDSPANQNNEPNH